MFFSFFHKNLSRYFRKKIKQCVIKITLLCSCCSRFEMKPKKAAFERNKEAIKKKNHGHWLRHGRQISAKRNLKQIQLKQLQLLKQIDGAQMKNLEIGDSLNLLSLNGSTIDNNNDSVNSDLHSDFMEKYINDSFDDDSTINQSDSYLEDDEEYDENFDDNLADEQVNFAYDFLNTNASEEAIREYDEVVSIHRLQIC